MTNNLLSTQEQTSVLTGNNQSINGNPFNYGKHFSVAGFKSAFDIEKIDIIKLKDKRIAIAVNTGELIAFVSMNYDITKEAEFVSITKKDGSKFTNKKGEEIGETFWLLHNKNTSNIEVSL